MALVTFEDLPSTNTPINANNLNNNFNELNTKISTRNYIQLKLASDYTIALSDTTYNVPFNTEMVKIGNKLTNYNNGVSIGNGVNHIKVSVFYVFFANTTGVKIGYIKKNTTTFSRFFSNRCYANEHNVFGVANFIIDVQENDLITFDTYASANDKIDALRTYVTVEVID